MILIPNRIANKIREIQYIFSSEEASIKQKTIILWPLIKNLIQIESNLLEEDELISEQYLICYRVIKNYNYNKSSLIPYLSKAIYWEINNFYKRQRKQDKFEIETIIDYYLLDENFYWQPEKILLEDKYLKDFTKSERFLILIIILSDFNKLDKTNLGIEYNLSRETVRLLLNNLKEKLK